jgi:hypothetical protein
MRPMCRGLPKSGLELLIRLYFLELIYFKMDGLQPAARCAEAVSWDRLKGKNR